MDPLTAVGAVASICQLAHAALSLSKTLYSLGSAIGSASEDVQILAEDLKTFSQSLTLLSRLLEDSKSWYSDDIYLLTAKIIKDCAELYVKIEKILAKLGANGKSNWKLRVKFVYKESEIKKLLKRLRDMKGTLATILMSLQVDLQLSLLNLSSSSSLSSTKSRSAPDVSLQPETLKTLKEAQKAVESGGFMTKYTVESEKVVQVSDKEVCISTTHREQVNRRQAAVPTGVFSRSMESQTKTKSEGPDFTHHQTNAFKMSQNFMMIPSDSANMQNVFARKNVSRAVVNEKNSQVCERKLVAETAKEDQVAQSSIDTDRRSVKSWSSVESFKSAKSIQEEDVEAARKIKAVQSVMHAFRTVLEILDSLVARRIEDNLWDLYASATLLKGSLVDGREHIDRRNIGHFKSYGHSYIDSFWGKHSTEVQRLGSVLMQDVGIKLHEYTAEHEDLDTSCFEILATSTRTVEQQILEYLDIVAESASTRVHYSKINAENPAGINLTPCVLGRNIREPIPKPLSPPTRWQYTRIQPEVTSQSKPVTDSETYPTSPNFSPTSPYYSPTSLSIPQVAYPRTDFLTFKRKSSNGGVIANYHNPSDRPRMRILTTPPSPRTPLPLSNTDITVKERERRRYTVQRGEGKEIQSSKPPSLLLKRGPRAGDTYPPRHCRRPPHLAQPEPQPSFSGPQRPPQSPPTFQHLPFHTHGSPTSNPPLIKASTLNQHPNSRGSPASSLLTVQKRNGRPVLQSQVSRPFSNPSLEAADPSYFGGSSFDHQGELDFTIASDGYGSIVEKSDFDLYLRRDSDTHSNLEAEADLNAMLLASSPPSSPTTFGRFSLQTPLASSIRISARCEECRKSNSLECDGGPTCSSCRETGRVCIYQPPSTATSSSTTMQISPIDSTAPKTTRIEQSHMTAAQFNASASNFQAVNFIPRPGYKVPASQCDYVGGPQQPPLPLLRIPEENWITSPSHSRPSHSSRPKSYTSAFKEEDMESEVAVRETSPGSNLRPLPPPPPPGPLVNPRKDPKNIWWSSFKENAGQRGSTEPDGLGMTGGEYSPLIIGSNTSQNLKHDMENLDDEEDLEDCSVVQTCSSRRRLRRKIGDLQGSLDVPKPQHLAVTGSPNKKYYVKDGLGQGISSTAKTNSPISMHETSNDSPATPAGIEDEVEHGKEVQRLEEKRREEIQAKREKLRKLRLTRGQRAGASANRSTPSDLVSAQIAPTGRDHSWEATTYSTMNPSEVQSLVDVAAPPPGASFPNAMSHMSNPISGQPTVGANHALQDYQMQLMLLEQQNKKRRMIAHQEKENRPHLMSGDLVPSVDPPSSLASTTHAQNRVNESARPIREHLHLPEASPENPQSSSSVLSDRLLQDYHEQAALTRQSQQEQQNNVRHQMSKNEETADEAVTILLNLDPNRKFKSPVRTSEADKALEDYQMSLMTLTCGNPRRRMMYRADDSAAENRVTAQIGAPVFQTHDVKAETCDNCGTSGHPSKDCPANRRAAAIAKAGLATAAVAGIVERCREKSPRRRRSRSRTRPGHQVTTAGLAAAAVAGLYESRKARMDRHSKYTGEDKADQRQSRSRSRVRSGSVHSNPELGMVQYGSEAVYRYQRSAYHSDENGDVAGASDHPPIHRTRNRSRSRSRLRSGQDEVAAAAISRYRQRKISKARARNAEFAKEYAGDSSQHGAGRPGEQQDHVMQDVLQDFDFDSFLHQDEGVDNFNFDSAVFSDPEPIKPNNFVLPVDSATTEPFATPTDTEDLPLFVNSKQFHRLLKRRMARQKLEEQIASRNSMSFLPDTGAKRASGESQDSSVARSDDPDVNRDQGTESAKVSLKFIARSSDPADFNDDDLYDDPDEWNTDNDQATNEKTNNFELNRKESRTVLAPPTLDSNPKNTKDIELAWSYPMLSPAQTSRLWWQTYISFIAASSRQSPVFTVLSSPLQSELGLSPGQYASDEDICQRVVDNIRPLSIAGSTLHEDRPELREVLFERGDIVRMLMTVDGRLGLKTATLGWSCVFVFLNIFGKVLNTTSSLCPGALSILESSFSQLQEIVHIIARYAVMENLYQQSITSKTNTTLSLKPEYQSSLLSLCSSILEWFATSFGIGKIVLGVSNGDRAGVGALAVLGDLDEKVVNCGALMDVIREKNKGCQIFRVEVDVKDESGSDGEVDDSDVEDVSDGSWEEIDGDDIKARVGVE